MKQLIGMILILAAVLLTGCSEDTYIYGERELKESVVEEIIADKLEVENPGLDIEVDVYQEAE
jgi:ABC-type glycerol-3-phosphate transport system substrate-binding protein